MKNHKRIIVWAVALIIIFAVVGFAADDLSADKTVTVEGVAVCDLGAPGSSYRHAALADALRRAVEKASGILVEADTHTKNYALEQDTVRTTSDGYVKDYRILDERLDGSVYRIKIEARVAAGNPALSLKSLCKRLKASKNPLFQVSVNDKSAQKIIAGELASLGLRVTESAGKVKSRINIEGDIFADSLGEMVADSGIFSSGASANLSVTDAESRINLPSVTVFLGQPIPDVSQSQADRKSAASVSKLWVQRNIPLIVTALLDPDKPQPAKDEIPAAQVNIGETSISAEPAITEAPDPNAPRVVFKLEALNHLAQKLKSAVEKSNLTPTPINIALAKFKLIGIKDLALADDVQEDLSTALTKTGVFELVERSQIDKVLGELRIQNSGLADTSTIIKLGKLVGVKAVLVGSISDRKDSYMINVRLINVESGRVQVAESIVIDKEIELEPVVLRAGPRR